MVTKKYQKKDKKNGLSQKKKGIKSKETEKDIETIEKEMNNLGRKNNNDESFSDVEIKSSKSISQIKKGDIITIDNTQYAVDAHYVLIEHGATKEMAIEIFDSKTDKDYQLRYFNDQVNTTLELYELQEIIYIRKSFKTISW